MAYHMTGCATTPAPAPPAKAEVISQPIFYPPLPNPPRIQYLASFSSSKDVSRKPGQKSSFAEFIVGKEKEDDKGIEVTKPYGVALHQGRIYVADTRGAGYAIFDLEKQEFHLINGSGPGKLEKPIHITVAEDGTKYITDAGRNQVLAFDQNDNFVKAYGVVGQFKPGDVEVVGDRLYVSDLEHHSIQVLDKTSGEKLFEFGETGLEKNKLMWPTNMSLGPDGNLYVTDTGHFCIDKYRPDGTFVQTFGIVGTGLGQFARPKGVALDREGRIYVVDAAFENVQVFDPEWKLLLFFGEPGGNPENINLPTAIAISYESAPFFQKYADLTFRLEYVVAVASQFGRSKVNIFGFGKKDGMDYTLTQQPPPKQPDQKQPPDTTQSGSKQPETGEPATSLPAPDRAAPEEHPTNQPVPNQPQPEKP